MAVVPFVVVIQATGENIAFDGFEQITFTYPTDVTKHRIEDGSKVTDHIQKNPVQVQATLFVTETPFQNKRTVGVVSTVNGQSTTKSGELPTGPTRLSKMNEFLDKARGESVTIIMPKMGYIRDMAISSFSWPIRLEGRAMVDTSFEKIEFAEAKSVKIPASKVKNKNVASSKDSGEQAGEKEEKRKEEQKKTFMASVQDSALGRFGSSFLSSRQ